VHAIVRLAITVVAIVLAGCGASAQPAPSGSPAPQPYWLRMTTTQAIAPLELFAVAPQLVITGEGLAVTAGPLLTNLVARPVSGAGQARIVQAARDLGLLSGQTDFTPAMPVMGGLTGRIELTVDGRRIVLTGPPEAQIVCVTTPCEPVPGTPEAFGELWRRLDDLASWLGSDLGPETAYVAPAYAILVGEPQQQPGMQQPVADWPLDQELASFGGPVASGTARCGTVSGAEVEALLPALRAANQLTPWVDSPVSSRAFGLTVRPMVTGEDVCRELFGP
jgi:hypothetical protein